MSEIKHGRLGLCGAEYSKCNHMMTLGFKGLTKQLSISSHVLFHISVQLCTENTVEDQGQSRSYGISYSARTQCMQAILHAEIVSKLASAAIKRKKLYAMSVDNRLNRSYALQL